MRTTAQTGDRWDENALGVWSVRDLVGHTSRALLTIETYLDEPVVSVQVTSPIDYFRLALSSVGDAEAVAQRGRLAGAALGADVAGAVEQIAQRVVARVEVTPEDSLVATPVGGMRLADYLPTRTFELTVHTCDLATALGQEVDVPPVAAEESLTVLGGLAARVGLAGPLLLAATGRSDFPRGFTVL